MRSAEQCTAAGSDGPVPSEALAPTLPQWRSQARELRFEGLRIATWTAGSGRPLLLVHGFPTAAWDFSRIWPALSRRHRLIACDLIGFGWSDKPRDGCSLLRQADLQQALLAAAGIDDCDLLLHDYGVSVGQELLARQLERRLPFRIGRAIFLNGGMFPGQHRPRLIQKLGAGPLGPLVSALLTRRRFGKSLAAVFGPHGQPDADELDAFWQLLVFNDGHRRVHRLLAYMRERVEQQARWVGALQAAARVLPLLHINGGLDPVSGRHVFEHWRQQLPEAAAVLLPQVGHYPQWEAPDAVGREVLAFLD